MKSLLICVVAGFLLGTAGNTQASLHTQDEFSFFIEYKICDRKDERSSDDPNDSSAFVLTTDNITAFCWVTDNDVPYSIAMIESSKIKFTIEEKRETLMVIFKFGGGPALQLRWANGFYVFPGILSGIEMRGPSKYLKTSEEQR